VAALVHSDLRRLCSSVLAIPTPEPLHNHAVTSGIAICTTHTTQTHSADTPRTRTQSQQPIHNTRPNTHRRRECASLRAACPNLRRGPDFRHQCAAGSRDVCSPSLMHSCRHTRTYAPATPQSRRRMHCTPTASQPRHRHCTHSCTRHLRDNDTHAVTQQ
jgi:hypothetical protein